MTIYNAFCLMCHLIFMSSGKRAHGGANYEDKEKKVCTFAFFVVILQSASSKRAPGQQDGPKHKGTPQGQDRFLTQKG